MRTPRTVKIRQDDTHRLIPSKYAEESVLTALADEEDDLSALYELEGATNGRLIAEAGRAPGIGVHELVFGIPNAHIINAAFCYPNCTGSRFNDSLRGAWYAGFEQETSIAEGTFHLKAWLTEVHWKPADWKNPQAFKYVDFRADFRGTFHSVRPEEGFSDCLGDDYHASQALAAQLLSEGSIGVVYPSVRHQGGACLACFRPALVSNVRRGESLILTFSSPTGQPSIILG